MWRPTPAGSGSSRVDALGEPPAWTSQEDDVSLPLPLPHQRWRCAGCGNLTRFDVTRTRRTTEFWHFDLAGDHQVEEIRTQVESVESVTCRWCGRADTIEVVERATVEGG